MFLFVFVGGFITGSLPNEIIKQEIINLCFNLKNDAVALVDVLAPPDFILNSALGMSDGKVSSHTFITEILNILLF